MAITRHDTYESLCDAARADIASIDAVAFAQASRAQGTITLDVRELDEWEDGVIPGSKPMPRGVLEKEIAAACCQGSICLWLK